MKAVENFPFISILIPVRNEVDYIERCLDAILVQDYPSDRIEVLIADGMSDDGTREKLQTFTRDHPCMRVFDNPAHIAASGLNMLTAYSKGDILIRVDGHCVIARDYVSHCVKHIREDDVDGVGGPMHSIGEDHLSQVIALAMSSKFGVGGSSFRTESGQTKFSDTVPFPAYTRAIIEQVGPYDEELVRDQDDEYNYRIRKAGGKILLAADVHSTYFSRSSQEKLWHQYYQYGFYKVRVLQKHPRQMSVRQFVPLAFVLTLIVTLVLAIITSFSWIALVGLAGVYTIANLIASLITASKEGWRYIWPLPITFATIHLSYGLGFLVGLFKFWNRWGD